MQVNDVTTAALDALTRKHTAFGSFAELANLEGDYFPSLYANGGSVELRALADAYDRAMIADGSPKRTFRGTAKPAESVVRISIIGGVAYVDQVPAGVTVEVTDYDVEATSRETDETGRPCSRYCVPLAMGAAA